MQQVIFYHYINEFGTYLIITQKFLQCLLRIKIEKMHLHYHIVHKGNMVLGKNQGNVKDKEITIQKENFSKIIASKIRSQIH